MAQLALQLFGPFQATLDGQSISGFDSDKVRALLAYLAVESHRSHRRQSLVGLFWPDFSESSARTNLRRALSNLRQIVNDKGSDRPFLLVTRHSVQFNLDSDFFLDVDLFDSIFEEKHNRESSFQKLQDAFNLYKGDFLEGFSLSDCQSFEEWLLVTRESKRERFVRVLYQLTAYYEEQANYERAAKLAQQQIRLEPYREEGHHQLMRILALSGQRNKAVQQYQELKKLLQEDLGVTPSPPTQELLIWLQSDTVPTPILKSSTKPSHNLPAQISRFIGRKSEINELISIIENHRLCTLVGAPGTGKSRLALEVASGVMDRFSDGVYFVNLAPINDPLLVPNAIGQVLEVREYSDRPLIENIKQSLEAKEVLLILDNFEQIIEAAPVVSDLLIASQGLKILATSREPLRVYGEQEYVVNPLTLPNLEQMYSTNALSQFEAVELFVQRAQAVDRGFSITEKNALTVAEICIRLDGLPLAIELAAARCKLLTPELILKRLEKRFSVLAHGARDLPPRQQTLRAAIDWSYELLAPDEKRFFSRLAVFQGGRNIAAIEAVCGSGLSFDVIDGLESLLNKSLIQQIVGPQGELRINMLETIHEYARERLEESGEVDDLRNRHANYYVSLVEQAEPELYGDRLPYWCDQLRVEFDNLRAALSWSMSNGDPEIGLRLVGGLREFWHGEGHISEGLRWANHILNKTENASQGIRAKALNAAGLFASVKGDRQFSEHLHLEALALARKIDDKLNQAWALLFLGRNITSWRDRHAEGMIYCEEALALFRESSYRPGIIQTLNMLGELARVAGDYDRAKKSYELCLDESHESGYRLRQVMTIANLSYIAQHEGDYERAEEYLLEALLEIIELGLKYHIASALAILVGPLTGQGESERAARILGATENLRKSMGGGLPPADQFAIDGYVATLKRKFDSDTFEKLKKEGEAMSLEEAIAYAFRRDQETYS
jgi:predicted ATPase/DNA-binding SARP family transcriptional activator